MFLTSGSACGVSRRWPWKNSCRSRRRQSRSCKRTVVLLEEEGGSAGGGGGGGWLWRTRQKRRKRGNMLGMSVSWCEPLDIRERKMFVIEAWRSALIMMGKTSAASTRASMHIATKLMDSGLRVGPSWSGDDPSRLVSTLFKARTMVRVRSKSWSMCSDIASACASSDILE